MTPEQGSEKTHADIWGEAPQFDNTHAVEGRGLAIDGAGGRWRGGSIWLLASQPVRSGEKGNRIVQGHG